MKRRVPLSSRAGLALVAAVGAAGAGEAGLRALGLPREEAAVPFLGPELASEAFVPDEELFWKLKAGPGSEANELGLRGWMPRGPKGPRDLRIACVGDSCTFGVGVRYEESWGVLLERALQEALPGRRVESVLAGNPGYSSHQNRLLFERHVAPLAPDVTVLYVGGWNDYVAAVGRSDRERSARRRDRWRSLRLVRLFAREDAGDRDAVMEAFRRDEAPHGRRVPLPDFDENVRAMIAAARGAGGIVLIVLPPLTEASLRTHPIAHEYRAATRTIARDAGVPLLDAPARFRELHAFAPPELRELPKGEWPCLSDWVHPNEVGHRVIAEGLFELLRRDHAVLFVDGATAPGAGIDAGGGADARPAIEAVEPAELPLFEAAGLVIRGSGFARPGAFDRLWLGEAWLRDFTVVDDGRIEARVERALRPGDHLVELITPAGLVRSAAPIRVRAPPLRATIGRADDQVVIEASCAARPDWLVTLWFSTALRPEPAATRFGRFELAADPDGRPPGLPAAPFFFHRLKLFAHRSFCGADGAWRERIELDVPDDVEAICMQAWIVAPDRQGDAVLTEAVRLVVPRER